MRVLIASLPIGTGHDIAARALAEEFLGRGVEVEFSHHLVPPARLATSLYFLGMRYLPRTYGATFRWADESYRLWQRHRRGWQRVGQSWLESVYREHRPDVVVATHPFALTAWSQVKKNHGAIRLIGVLTDLSCHRFWYEPLADAYTVWLPEQAEDLKRMGISESSIWQTGIPIRSSFHESPLYSQLPRGPVVLLGGGLGLGPYYRILKQLSHLSYPVMAVCGHNEKLLWQLEQHRWPDTVSIVGYVEQMPVLLRNSRVVVGKPGGVTAAEVAQSTVPWVLSHWIPGQEEINRDRLVMHGLAANGRQHLVATIQDLASQNSPARQRMQDHQKSWSRPYAARDIVSRVMEL